jgi:chaperonin GroES
MKIVKPLSNRVVIKRHATKLTKGGILLVESSQDKPTSGEVIAVGPGKQDDWGNFFPMSVSLGDKVLFSAYAGSSIEQNSHNDEELLVLSEDDILAIIQ